MKDSIIQQLVEEILKSYNLKLDGDEINVAVTQDDENFEIKINCKVNDEFKRYVDELDEDLFMEACDRFEEETGISLNEFAHNPDFNTFKSVVNTIIKERIEDLSKLLR